jgi:hypothetical protein
MAGDARTIQNECYSCEHRRTCPGDCHSSCAVPDPNMKGEGYGIQNGWFFYPINFDPTWKIKWCNNYKNKEA